MDDKKSLSADLTGSYVPFPTPNPCSPTPTPPTFNSISQVLYLTQFSTVEQLKITKEYLKSLRVFMNFLSKQFAAICYYFFLLSNNCIYVSLLSSIYKIHLKDIPKSADRMDMGIKIYQWPKDKGD